jgi:2'-5' RNA ligase
MRLFIALPLPDTVTAALEAAQNQLKRTRRPVKWVTPASIHLTLQFLGEQNEALVPELLAALTGIQPEPAALPQLQLTRIGAFPDLRRPQTIWMGIGGDLERLAGLQRAVVRATGKLGLPAESRAFRPHLTLGRVRRDAERNAIHELSRALMRAAAPPALSWHSHPPILYKSTLGSQGARYEALGPATY